MAWLSSPIPPSSPGPTPLTTPGHTPSLCRCLLHTMLVSVTPSVVKLPDSGMNSHLRFYHLPPVPPLRELVTIIYPINFPSPHYVFLYDMCIISIVRCMLCIRSPAIHASLYYVHTDKNNIWRTSNAPPA